MNCGDMYGRRWDARVLVTAGPGVMIWAAGAAAEQHNFFMTAMHWLLSTMRSPTHCCAAMSMGLRQLREWLGRLPVNLDDFSNGP